jgi:hypothetical protein
MASELSTLSQLFLEIQKRAAEVLDPNDPRTGLDTLFIQAISVAMDDIRRGASSEEFQELAIINLLFGASDAGYGREEIKSFVMALKRDR